MLAFSPFAIAGFLRLQFCIGNLDVGGDANIG
jgi:hypothetical protein